MASRPVDGDRSRTILHKTVETNSRAVLRSASFIINTIDAATGMVFDVLMTYKAIYPVAGDNPQPAVSSSQWSRLSRGNNNDHDKLPDGPNDAHNVNGRDSLPFRRFGPPPGSGSYGSTPSGRVR
jgi:hypothetical protein